MNNSRLPASRSLGSAIMHEDDMKVVHRQESREPAFDPTRSQPATGTP